MRTTLGALFALIAGYALSAAVSTGLALALPRALGMSRAEAVVLSSMLGFLLYLALLLWAFTTPTLARGSARAAPSVRKSMSALHTWAGVLLGGLLFAVFWMGTLSVFDREIDRWMMPATRLGPPPAHVSLDATVRPALAQLAPDVEQWSVVLPTERTPSLLLRYPAAAGSSELRHIDPRSGVIADAGTLGGTGFIFPFHFGLHLGWLDLGIWLVGLAAMGMLVLVVSGVVIHVHLFKELFTFRPKKALSRSSLDLHTTMGVLALPFHFVMPLSGLIIFFSIFFPGTWQAVYAGDRAAFNRDTFGIYQRPKANVPAELASLDVMVAEAERGWGHGAVSSLRVSHAGDANSYVEVRRSTAGEVTMHRDRIYFDGSTGGVLARLEGNAPVMTVQRFIAGIHFVQFDHWTLRWLYFLLGLAACVMIGTGFLFWLESRRARHARQGLGGVKVVEALTIGSVTGIIVATLAFFVANRVLPAGASFAGMARPQLEMLAFYVTWFLTFAHARWRGQIAWEEQCWGIAALACAAVALNGVTTGDHLVHALGRGAWGVAGMDGLLLSAAAVAGTSARHLRRRFDSSNTSEGAVRQRTDTSARMNNTAHG